jgi:hypothetical protein
MEEHGTKKNDSRHARRNCTLKALSVKLQSCVECAERFAYWIMSESPPQNMASVTIICCKTELLGACCAAYDHGCPSELVIS